MSSDHQHFEGRDLPPYAIYVDPDRLIEGETYFSVHFVDEEGEVPQLRPFVFIGRDLEPDSAGEIYFQDAASHAAGERFEGDEFADGNEADEDGDPVESVVEIHRMRAETPFAMEFEDALNVLLRCSLLRAERLTPRR
jgi:hypothetical protein